MQICGISDTKRRTGPTWFEIQIKTKKQKAQHTQKEIRKWKGNLNSKLFFSGSASKKNEQSRNKRVPFRFFRPCSEAAPLPPSKRQIFHPANGARGFCAIVPPVLIKVCSAETCPCHRGEIYFRGSTKMDKTKASRSSPFSSPPIQQLLYKSTNR